MIRNAFIALAALSVAACAQPNQQFSGGTPFVAPSPVASAPPAPPPPPFVRVDDTQFERTVRFTGPSTDTQSHILANGIVRSSHLLRSFWNRDTGRVTHQVYWHVIYRDSSWRFYNRANDDSARVLPAENIGREVVSCAGSSRGAGCLYSETMIAPVDEAVLRSVVRDGRNYCVKFYSRVGNEDVRCVTPALISAQLAAVESRRGRSPTPAAASGTAQPHRR